MIRRRGWRGPVARHCRRRRRRRRRHGRRRHRRPRRGGGNSIGERLVSSGSTGSFIRPILGILVEFFRFHPPVLKPYFHLAFRQVKGSGYLEATIARQVPIKVKFFLQLEGLVTGVSLASAFLPVIVARLACKIFGFTVKNRGGGMKRESLG